MKIAPPFHFSNQVTASAEGLSFRERISSRCAAGVSATVAAAPAVAGQGLAGHRIVPGQDSLENQGEKRHDKSRRVATGHADPPGITDPFSLLPAEFRDSVNPVRIGAVSRAGIDDFRPGVGYHRHGFSGGGVRQTQEHDIGFVKKFLPTGDIFAFVRFDFKDKDVLTPDA